MDSPELLLLYVYVEGGEREKNFMYVCTIARVVIERNTYTIDSENISLDLA